MQKNLSKSLSHNSAISSSERDAALLKLHNELYDIMQEILRVCRELNLHPFLQGGSAIGAFFEQKILPWDDDIDMGLVRNEYETFINKAPSVINPQYFVQSCKTEPNMFMPSLLKVRKNNTFYWEEGWNDVPLHHGIFVDIMPYDKVPDDLKKQRRQRWIVRKMGFAISNITLWQYWFKKKIDTSSRENFVYSLKSFLWYFFFNRKITLKLYDRISTRYNNCRNCSYYNQVPQYRDHIPVESVENLVETTFGPLTAYIPSNVEKYLRNHYPNLRRTIPESERESHMPKRLEFSDGSVFEE